MITQCTDETCPKSAPQASFIKEVKLAMSQDN